MFRYLASLSKDTKPVQEIKARVKELFHGCSFYALSNLWVNGLSSCIQGWIISGSNATSTAKGFLIFPYLLIYIDSGGIGHFVGEQGQAFGLGF